MTDKCFIWRLTQNHENKIHPQDIREADRGSNGFRQTDGEEFGLIKDGNGLYHSNSYMGLRNEMIFSICV